MDDANHELVLEVLRQMRTLLRSMDAHYRQVERRSGLGGAQLWALSEVAVPQGLTMGELAGRLAIQASTASNLVRRLEELGLVARVQGQGDRRVVRLFATPAGRRKLRAAPKPSAGLLQEALMKMTGRELDALRAQLELLLKRLGNVDKRAETTFLADILGKRR